MPPRALLPLYGGAKRAQGGEEGGHLLRGEIRLF